MVLISVDNLWKYEYGSDLAIFPALAIFLSSTLPQYGNKTTYMENKTTCLQGSLNK
jgi:hypothetical protein